MSKRFWKLLAITEFVLMVLGVIALYMKVFMPSTVKEVLSILLCVIMLMGFLAGSTGWLAIIAMILDKKEQIKDDDK